jgi:hypothetical protein
VFLYSYVIWENLEFLIDSNMKNGLKPSYFGRTINNLLPNGYTSGGAGYLISRQAAELVIREGPKKNGCPKSGALEDHDIGRLYEFSFTSVASFH